MPTRSSLTIAVLLTAALVACSDGSVAPTPTATLRPQPTATATPEGLGAARPDVERIVEHTRVLSVEIGVRVAGSDEEAEAIAYAREHLERWGYEVEVQSFPVTSPMLRATTLSVGGADDGEVVGMPFFGAPSGTVVGRLVDAGFGRAGEFPQDAAGAVVLIQRRDVTFVNMVARAQAAGASAVVVVNREPGRFLAGFRDSPGMPVINIDQADGEALRGLLADGPVEVTLIVEDEREMIAHNVIARLSGSSCRTISGGHYDSVPVSAGATDNASGSAVVLELARAVAAASLSGHCFVLFGAEETGLSGSRFFVAQLTGDERDALLSAYNYDVTGGAGAANLIGSEALVAQAETLAERDGLDVSRSSLPEGASSDHASFLEAGIPALMLTFDDFDLLHTVQDTFSNLEPASLETIAALGFALLQEMDTP